MMLNVITPLQKFTKGGITLVDVLWQRYYDLYQAEMTPKLLVITEDVFTGKREVSSMCDRSLVVRLFAFYYIISY